MFYTAYERVSESDWDRLQDSCGQDERKYPPNIALPRFCHRSSWCEQGPMHEGACDPLEVVQTLTIDRVNYYAEYDGELIELSYQPFQITQSNQRKTMSELLPEKPTANDPNSNRWFWYNIGDEIEGLYFDYDPEAKQGSFVKPMLTLKTPTGKKFVDVPNDLRRKIEGPALRGALEGKWLRLRFIEEKDIKGREHPAKIIKAEQFASQAEAGTPRPAQHRTERAPQAGAPTSPETEDEIPF